MNSRFRFKTVRSWLTLWLLLLGLLPVIISSVIVYQQRVELLRTRSIESLTAIRDLKVRQVDIWLKERLDDGKIIAESQEIASLAKILRKEPDLDSLGKPDAGRDEHIAAMRILLSRYLNSLDSYNELFVIDSAEGNVLVSSDKGDEGRLKSDYPYFAETLKQRKTIISDIYFSKTLRRPSMVLSIPIFDLEEKSTIVAVLVARFDLEHTIYDLLRERIGMGETGETLIVNQAGFAVNELRWQVDAPLKLKITATPAMLAIQGNTGVVEADDYRKVRVLAAYTHLPQFGWGFVSKQDSAEVFASVQRMLINTLVLVGVFSALIILCAFYIAKRITAPIQEMKEVSSRLQSGDLTARNAFAQTNELGFLGQSINTLAASIQTQIKVQQGSSEIIKTLVAAESLQDFAQKLLRNLLTATDSRLAALYLLNEENQTFQNLTAIGANVDALKSFDATSLEGELGIALASKRIEHITAIPADTRFTYNTVAGQALPREIVTIPLLVRNEVKGIVSLANLNGYSAESLEIMQRCWLPMSAAFDSVLASEQAQLMAAQLAEKNEELTANNEELQVNAEELQAQTEELLQQAEELRETAAELEKQRLQVEGADRLKSEFLSNMSHELRTPLNSVLALSQLMITRGTGKDPAEEKNFLQVIERNGRQLLNLINDILDLSKIESGRMDIYPALFDSRQVVERALETIRPLAEGKGQRLEVDLSGAPEMTSDENKVNQILLNLLSNAVKFTEQGNISVQVKATEQKVSFVVSDTGIGLLPEDLSHIFDEFRQVDGSVTRRHEGTGLGLAICQKLAILLGGQILVESVFGEGSSFTLELPLRRAVPVEGRPVALPEPKIAAMSGAVRTILVLDDEHEVQELIARHLTEAGYKVALAANAKDGLRMAKELKPFAITLDILMPEMDGWEVLKELKADPATAAIPVIMLSVSEDRATGMALGACGYLTKPVNKNLLLSEVEKIACRKQVKRILVVDDDPVARSYAQKALAEKGYRVELAEGGDVALRFLQESTPDLMLLDLMMPDISGFKVLDELRKMPHCRELPVIVLTAKDLTHEERLSLKTSVKKVLSKRSVGKAQLLKEIVSTLKQLEPAGRAAATSAKALILVVEDNATAALQVRTALEDNGYAVTVATNGEEALTCVNKEVPDGVVLDLMMPGIDGFQVLEAIRSTPWTALLPVVVLTAKELTSEERARLTNNNIKQLIQKGSVDRSQLVAAVGAMIRKAEVKPGSAVQPKPKVAGKGKRTLLIVEDNPDNLLAITSALAGEGYVIISAEDGLQAVELTEEARPDLILMDMQLPILSGLEAVKRIKANLELAEIPIVALTANAMKGDREKMLGAGCVDYLSKPFVPAALQQLVRRLIKV